MSFVTYAEDYRAVRDEARAIAAAVGARPCAAHALLGLFTCPNMARLILNDFQINEELLLMHYRAAPGEPLSLEALERAAVGIAKDTNHGEVTALHILIATARAPERQAAGLLRHVGLDLAQLERATLRCIEDPVERARLRGRYEHAPAVVQLSYSDTVESPALADVFEAISSAEASDEVLVGVSPERHSQHKIHGGEARGREQRHGERRARLRGRRAADRRGEGEDRRAAPGRRASDLPQGVEARVEDYALDPEETPWLCRLGVNLSLSALRGELDPVIEREGEIAAALDILNKRRNNNPCLVGPPGVGKTAIAEGLALRSLEMERGEATGPRRIFVQLDVSGILAGTRLRGALAERLQGLQREVSEAAGRIVIFIDELHTLLASADGGPSPADDLKASLARGAFPCVGATTEDEYQRHIEGDPALERRFAAVYVEEPSEAATRRILEGLVARYAAHHGVRYTPQALDAAARLGRRYLHDRRDPDRALGILDLAGAIARREGGVVDEAAVAAVVAQLSRVPVEHIRAGRAAHLLELEARLSARIEGQAHVIQAVAEGARRGAAGFGGEGPMASFLFLGPTGVGKTALVKALAEALFGARDALTRLDMSEYAEGHTAARLIGAPPGYIGHGEGGQLTETVRRRPYQIVLFDEIEKAHREVWHLLLQILEEGQLTDSRGRVARFHDALIILTSNLGAEAFSQGALGFGGVEADRARRAEKLARQALPPELWARLGARLIFHPLSEAQIMGVGARLIAEGAARLKAARGVSVEIDDAALRHLIQAGGFDPQLGARPMRQAIARLIEAPLAARILRGEVPSGSTARITVAGEALAFEITPAQPKARESAS